MTHTILFSVVFLLLACTQVILGLPYDKKSNVISLTKNNFADRVFGSENIWVVEFYAPWCGHCKNLAPEYEKAANNLKGIVPVAAVNCDEEKELCGNFGIQGFPTIKVFPSKVTPVKGKSDAFQKVPEDYTGARTAASIVNYALGKLPSFVVPVTSKSEEKFLSQELPKAILFTNKDKTSDLYKALSIDFHNRMVLGEAKHTDTKLVEKYGVDSFPTLLVLKEDGNVKFDGGKLTVEYLTAFLEPYAVPAPEKPSSSGKSSKSKPKEPEPEPETGEIFEVKDQASFDAHCGSKGGLCVVAFLDRENFDQADWDRYVDMFTTLGQKFKGKLRIVYLDGPSQPALTRALDISAFYPNVVVLNPKKLAYTPFKGDFSQESLVEYFDQCLAGRRKTFKLDALPTIATEVPKPPRTHVPEDDLEEEPVKETKLKDEI